MDTEQGAKLDIRASGKSVDAEVCGIDLSRDLDDAVYTHKWQAGDIIMWDNYLTQHMAVGDCALPQRRLMHRTAICGVEEFGAKVLAD